ncbi:hypothetical protein Prum_091740 [Phytohabitans rumicis]|uniref:Transcription regulator MerR DNA binding domain-containing protein n=2 Tax=Phytohabitans rumicis TaxID=1076125 RepID=A0A6V8LE64_9ACTN|nr:hypothetical protein Prum_091740 [Phytohabitans rumicis]
MTRPGPNGSGWPHTAAPIRMARMLQNLGFTLDEIIEMLHAHDTGTATCDSEQWRLESALDRIDTKIAELRRTRRLITTTIQECRTGHCRFAAQSADGWQIAHRDRHTAG